MSNTALSENASVVSEFHELLPPDSPLAAYVSVDRARMHGEPCFKGTRVPVQILFDHLREGDPMSDFLEGFPDVTREQATAVVDLAAQGILNGLRRLLKVLLDNCVRYRANALFVGHVVSHARNEGWRQISNGELLALASGRFDVFVTTDKKIRYEQNLDMLPTPIVELNPRFTRWAELLALAQSLNSALDATRSYLFVSLGPDGSLERLAPRMRP